MLQGFKIVRTSPTHSMSRGRNQAISCAQVMQLFVNGHVMFRMRCSPDSGNILGSRTESGTSFSRLLCCAYTQRDKNCPRAPRARSLVSLGCIDSVLFSSKVCGPLLLSVAPCASCHCSPQCVTLSWSTFICILLSRVGRGVRRDLNLVLTDVLNFHEVFFSSVTLRFCISDVFSV